MAIRNWESIGCGALLACVGVSLLMASSALLVWVWRDTSPVVSEPVPPRAPHAPRPDFPPHKARP